MKKIEGLIKPAKIKEILENRESIMKENAEKEAVTISQRYLRAVEEGYSKLPYWTSENIDNDYLRIVLNDNGYSVTEVQPNGAWLISVK